MKVLIWIAVMLLASIIQILARKVVGTLGGIPSAVLFCAMLFCGTKACKAWDEHIRKKKDYQEHNSETSTDSDKPLDFTQNEPNNILNSSINEPRNLPDTISQTTSEPITVRMNTFITNTVAENDPRSITTDDIKEMTHANSISPDAQPALTHNSSKKSRLLDTMLLSRKLILALCILLTIGIIVVSIAYIKNSRTEIGHTYNSNNQNAQDKSKEPTVAYRNGTRIISYDEPQYLKNKSYKDPDTNCEFEVPKNWVQVDLSENREYIKAKFKPNGEENVCIIYGSIDVWNSIPVEMKQNNTRSDINNSILTENDFKEMTSLSDVKDVSTVSYAGKEYYCAESKETLYVNDKEIDCHYTSLGLFENGYLYTFSFFDISSNKYYQDFVSLMESVCY